MRSEGIISFRIFDRWGAQLFESYDASQGWDGTYKGKLMEIGVYMYFIEYPCPVDGSIQIKRGNITIIR
jgi:gliding motility-associated-like protein